MLCIIVVWRLTIYKGNLCTGVINFFQRAITEFEDLKKKSRKRCMRSAYKIYNTPLYVATRPIRGFSHKAQLKIIC